MKYLLDTNLCVEYIRGKNPHVIAHLRAHPASDVSVCSVVVAELLHGAEKSHSPVSERAKVFAFVAPYFSFPFDDRCAEFYASIRADLQRRGLLIGGYDMLIAATARANQLTLVTHNTAEFSRIPGLTLVDWEVP